MFGSDTADRTLPPTERRRRDARHRGDVVRSAELTSAVVLLTASCAFWWFGPACLTELASMIRRALTTSPTIPSITVLTRQAGDVLVAVLIPIASLVALCAAFANLAQTGWVWNPASIVPSWRLRTLISRERLAETSGLGVRLTLLLVVTWSFFKSHQSQFLSLGMGEPAFLLERSAKLIGELSIQLSTCLVGLAFVDYAWRFWCHEQRLKMTVEERRREQQEDEVNPEIKRRRSATHHQPSSATPSVESIGNFRR